MDFESFSELIQLTISPVVLISGVGLLLLTLSNRIARPIDRARLLSEEILKAGDQAREEDRIQLDVLLKRCEILRLSLGFLGVSILSATLISLFMVISAFAPLFLRLPILITLSIGVLSIVISVGLFLYDVALSLKALKVEVGATREA